MCLEFLCDSVGEGQGIVTAAAWVAAVVQVGWLAWELPYATGMAKKEKEKICVKQ